MEVAGFIEQMANKAGIPSSVMRDGLSNKTLEWQARLAWKYACSSKFFNHIFTIYELSWVILKLEHSVNLLNNPMRTKQKAAGLSYSRVQG